MKHPLTVVRHDTLHDPETELATLEHDGHTVTLQLDDGTTLQLDEHELTRALREAA